MVRLTFWLRRNSISRSSTRIFGNWWLMSDAAMTDISFNFGELWMLAASLAMALGTILIRFTCTKSDPVAVTGWHMVLGSVPLIIVSIACNQIFR